MSRLPTRPPSVWVVSPALCSVVTLAGVRTVAFSLQSAVWLSEGQGRGWHGVSGSPPWFLDS